jgi:hypothetical protein
MRVEGRASLLLSAPEQSDAQLIDRRELSWAEPPIGKGARDGERGADRGESVDCTGGRRAPDARGRGGDAAEPIAASARGAPQHRAPTASGPIPQRSYLWLAEPIYRMRSVGAISAESRFHAAGNRSSPVVRPSTHALTRVAQDAGAVPSLSKDALSPSSREASGRPCHSHRPRSCTVTMRRLLECGIRRRHRRGKSCQRKDG